MSLHSGKTVVVGGRCDDDSTFKSGEERIHHDLLPRTDSRLGRYGESFVVAVLHSTSGQWREEEGLLERRCCRNGMVPFEAHSRTGDEEVCDG